MFDVLKLVIAKGIKIILLVDLMQNGLQLSYSDKRKTLVRQLPLQYNKRIGWKERTQIWCRCYLNRLTFVELIVMYLRYFDAFYTQMIGSVLSISFFRFFLSFIFNGHSVCIYFGNSFCVCLCCANVMSVWYVRC